MIASTARPAADRESRSPPPRERILAAARELFYRRGIHAVGVDAIAEAAGTNKMTLYRHFTSKDVLVAACLSELTQEFDAAWDALAVSHAGDPEGQPQGHRIAQKIGQRQLAVIHRGVFRDRGGNRLAHALH